MAHPHSYMFNALKGSKFHFYQIFSIECEKRPTLENGHADIPDPPVFEQEIQYSCNPGYDLIGKNTATCQSNGKWTKKPSCNPIRKFSFLVCIPNFQLYGLKFQIYSTSIVCHYFCLCCFDTANGSRDLKYLLTAV